MVAVVWALRVFRALNVRAVSADAGRDGLARECLRWQHPRALFGTELDGHPEAPDWRLLGALPVSQAMRRMLATEIHWWLISNYDG